MAPFSFRCGVVSFRSSFLSFSLPFIYYSSIHLNIHRVDSIRRGSQTRREVRISASCRPARSSRSGPASPGRCGPARGLDAPSGSVVGSDDPGDGNHDCKRRIKCLVTHLLPIPHTEIQDYSDPSPRASSVAPPRGTRCSSLRRKARSRRESLFPLRSPAPKDLKQATN